MDFYKGNFEFVFGNFQQKQQQNININASLSFNKNIISSIQKPTH